MRARVVAVVTPDDVAAGFKTLWDGSHVVDASLVPNGVHYQRAPSGTQPPYGVFTVEEGEAERFSGSTYIHPFTVKLAIYAKSGSEGPETDEKRRAIEARMQDQTKPMTVPNADQVIDRRPAGGGLEYANQMKDAQNVVLASGAWEVLVQATR